MPIGTIFVVEENIDVPTVCMKIEPINGTSINCINLSNGRCSIRKGSYRIISGKFVEV